MMIALLVLCHLIFTTRETHSIVVCISQMGNQPKSPVPGPAGRKGLSSSSLHENGTLNLMRPCLGFSALRHP